MRAEESVTGDVSVKNDFPVVKRIGQCDSVGMKRRDDISARWQDLGTYPVSIKKTEHHNNAPHHCEHSARPGTAPGAMQSVSSLENGSLETRDQPLSIGGLQDHIPENPCSRRLAIVTVWPVLSGASPPEWASVFYRDKCRLDSGACRLAVLGLAVWAALPFRVKLFCRNHTQQMRDAVEPGSFLIHRSERCTRAHAWYRWRRASRHVRGNIVPAPVRLQIH